ncbi:MAG: hypothetical protein V7707_13905 [Motiliproteus sp.]
MQLRLLQPDGWFVCSNALPCGLQVVTLQDLLEQIMAKGWLRVITLSHVIAGRHSCIQV